MSFTTLAPADKADSLMALFSTCVAFEGTHTKTLGLGERIELLEMLMNQLKKSIK